MGQKCPQVRRKAATMPAVIGCAARSTGFRVFEIDYRSLLPEGRVCSAESPISLRWLFTSRNA
jgi:hypothetical protein